MTIKTNRTYKLIVEKPYCCVPATIQMILERRGLHHQSQDDIGSQLGLIVPPDMASQFSNVRIGPEPKAGYGTQISKDEFSIQNYFKQQDIPLNVEDFKPGNLKDLEKTLKSALANDDDIVICYDSKRLFGEGDREHFSLVQSIDENDHLEIIDPAIGAPPLRTTTIQKLFEVLNGHKVSNIGGIWLFSSNMNDGLLDKFPGINYMRHG